MSYLPCKNPNCKSYGQPHPNCKCYGGLADGGDAHFCSRSQAHGKDCEYYAEGGDTEDEGLDELPPGFEIVPEKEETAAPAPDDDEGLDELPPGFQIVGEEKPEPGVGDQLIAGAQAVNKGLFGPASEWLVKNNPFVLIPEGEKELSYEAQKERREANPNLSAAVETAAMVGSLAMGTGQAAAAERLAQATTGSKVLQGAIQAGLLSSGDQVSKWIMGEEPESAVGAVQAIGANALFGGFAAGTASLGSFGAKKGLEKLGQAKFGAQALSWLEGVAAGTKSLEPEAREAAKTAAKDSGAHLGQFLSGMKFADKIVAPSGTGAAIGAFEGYKDGGLEGAAKGAVEGMALGWLSGKVLQPLGRKYLAPAIIKALSKGPVPGFADAIDHASKMVSGSKMLDGAIDEALHQSPIGGKTLIRLYGDDNAIQDMKTFMGEGGVTKNLQEQVYQDNEQIPGYAHGGDVATSPAATAGSKNPVKPILDVDQGVATHYPAHNAMLMATRGRVSQYLNSLRPLPNAPKLPFDAEPDQRKKTKDYDRALGIAAAPLKVLGEIQKGTVLPQDVKHLSSMYPELTTLLQKKITDKIVSAQLEGKNPPYKVRQGLSMLLGAPLSTEMTPQSIQAAQAVFARKSPGGQPQAGQASKPSASATQKLSKSDQAYLTQGQSLVRRSQRPS